MALEGLVADPHLDLDSQIAILAAIEETGSASLGDVMALRPDHPSPGHAIMALIREGEDIPKPKPQPKSTDMGAGAGQHRPYSRQSSEP